MDLKDLRNTIDCIDKEILELFIKRMEICKDVAEYKKANNLPVFQGNRENELLDNIKAQSPDEYKSGSQLLFTNIMDISKCLQQKAFYNETNHYSIFNPENANKIACQGTEGSYSQQAARQLFGDKEIKFYNDFEDVFIAVENNDVEYGVLPIKNSTAGSVSQTYDLMRKYSFNIVSLVNVKISHCLVAKKNYDLNEISKVISHEQAISQCSEFLNKNKLKKEFFINTASAAKYVSECNEPIAAICSFDCAKLYGLEILNDNITNEVENYTQFIVISKALKVSLDADIIAVTLTLPNTPKSLYRLLTKFSVLGLNLSRIESKLIKGTDFDVVFYLEFEGSIRNPDVFNFIQTLKDEFDYFKFLGNYREV